MKRVTHYLNTDLDLAADHCLKALAAAFEAKGAFPLHVDQRDDGRWYSTLETDEQFTEPEPNIAAFLNIIEAFGADTQELWAACDCRELNIGYECGDDPWAFNHGLGAASLARMAALGISLRITLYPSESATSKTSEFTHDA